MSFDNIDAPQNILCADKFAVAPLTNRHTSAALADERLATVSSLLSGWIWETIDGDFILKQGAKLLSLETSVED